MVPPNLYGRYKSRAEKLPRATTLLAARRLLEFSTASSTFFATSSVFSAAFWVKPGSLSVGSFSLVSVSVFFVLVSESTCGSFIVSDEGVSIGADFGFFLLFCACRGIEKQ